MSAGGFLSRWSRRKAETRKGQVEPEPPASDEARPDDGEGGSGQAPTGAAAAELPPEDLAALPRLEDLTPDTDLTPFMRAGVPRLLRQAALRRMWSLDPAIRDYVGDARDYSYDWNVPGGVPVSGPLAPSEDPLRAIEKMFSRTEEEPSAPQPRPATADANTPRMPTEPDAPAAADRMLPDGAGAESGQPRSEGGPAGLDHVPAMTRVEARAEPAHAAPGPGQAGGGVAPGPEPSRRRRHGSAIPKLD